MRHARSTTLGLVAAVTAVGCGAMVSCDDAPKVELPRRAASADPEPAAAPPDPAASPGVVARVDEPRPDPADSAAAHGVRVVRRTGQTEPEEGADVQTPSPEDRWMKCEQFDIDYRGKRLRSLRIGKPGGREVLLLHGARFNSRTWLELGTLEFLAKNGCRAMAIDLPGFGKSEEVPARPEEFLFHVLPFLDLKRPVVVFPSMSGSFAFPFAIAHPELVAGLVPVAPVAIDDHAAKLEGLDLAALIVWGEKDTVVPIAKAETLRRLLPRSEKIVLAGASHPCYLDQPQQFHAALLRFLKSLDRPR